MKAAGRAACRGLASFLDDEYVARPDFSAQPTEDAKKYWKGYDFAHG
jgi:hypothetical protein